MHDHDVSVPKVNLETASLVSVLLRISLVNGVRVFFRSLLWSPLHRSAASEGNRGNRRTECILSVIVELML